MPSGLEVVDVEDANLEGTDPVGATRYGATLGKANPERSGYHMQGCRAEPS